MTLLGSNPQPVLEFIISVKVSSYLLATGWSGLYSGHQEAAVTATSVLYFNCIDQLAIMDSCSHTGGGVGSQLYHWKTKKGRRMCWWTNSGKFLAIFLFFLSLQHQNGAVVINKSKNEFNGKSKINGLIFFRVNFLKRMKLLLKICLEHRRTTHWNSIQYGSDYFNTFSKDSTKWLWFFLGMLCEKT